MQPALLLATSWLIGLTFALPLKAETQETAIPLCRNSTTLLTNATFITLDPKQPQAKALALSNQRIVALGDPQVLEANCRGKDTQVIDLKGAVVVPGFIDTHSQFLFYGWLADHALDLSTTNVFQRADWQPIKTTEEFLTAIKNTKPQSKLGAVKEETASQNSTAKKEWLIVNGYDPARMMGPPLTQKMLDETEPNQALIVFYSSGQQAMVNQVAAKKLASQEQGDKIQINNEGLIQNKALQSLIKQLISPEEATQAIETAAKLYAKQGYTTITEAQAHPEWLASYENLTNKVNFPLDVVLNPTTIPEKQRIDVIYLDNPRLYSGPMIVEFDGLAHEHRAYFTHTYLPEGGVTGRGNLNYPPKELEKLLLDAVHAKVSIAIESNGDAALDLALNLINKVQLLHKEAAFRPLMFNAEFARNDQLQRMHQLGLKVSWFSPQLYYWGDAFCQKILGPRFAAQANPLTTAQKILGAINIHANSPATPPLPLQMMQFVNSAQIQNWYFPPTKQCPKQFWTNEDLSSDKALRALTLEAAKFYSLEKDKGALMPGKLADMTILGANPLTTKNLDNIKVLGTIARGQLHLNHE